MKEFFERLLAAIRAFFRRIFGPKEPGDTTKVPSSPHAKPWRTILTEPVFESFDWTALARAFDLEKRGYERGRAGLPPSDHDELDEVEREILRQAETLVKKERDTLENIARERALASSAVRIQATIENVAPFTNNAIAELRARSTVLKNKLAPLAEAARLRITDLNRFREENGLTYPADGAESTLRRLIVGWAIILAMLVVETLINGSAIASGMYGGLVSGWSVALGIALLNTFVAFLLGWGAKWLRHPNLRYKSGGLFFLLFWLLANSVVNLSVALFRGALEIDPDNAATLVMKNVWPPNLKILNFYSMLLLGIGMLFSTIAFLDGLGLFGFDDHFPSYGRKTRACNRVRDRFNENFESAIKQISRLKEEKIKRVREECLAGC